MDNLAKHWVKGNFSLRLFAPVSIVLERAARKSTRADLHDLKVRDF